MFNVSDSSIRIILKLRMMNKPKVFMCIGTPNHIWDSYGPMVGTMLKNRGDVVVFGTMDNPVDAFNVMETEAMIREKYPNHILITLDGAVTRRESESNMVWVKECGLIPGEAFNRDLDEIGDFCIQYGILLADKNSSDKRNPERAANETIDVINRILD